MAIASRFVAITLLWWTWGRITASDRSIASILRNVDADVVVLNEVDFDAAWSGGVNQAQFLAEAAGYEVRIEQRNFDMRAPFLRLGFGRVVHAAADLSDHAPVIALVEASR